MGAEPRPDDAHRESFRQTANHTKSLELIVHREAVAALDFQRGRAVGGKLLDPRDSELVQLLFAAITEVANRRMDATASLRDLHVVVSLSAQLVLLEPR